jgi:putative transposase
VVNTVHSYLLFSVHFSLSVTHAQELVKKAIFKHGVFNTPLVLHSDNGSPMKAQDFQNLLSRLGITKSYSRPRVSNDNPYSESLFKTLKYTKDFPNKGFKSLEEARKWVYHFVNLYNTEFLHSGIKFVTPHQRHYGLDIKLLEKRNEVYKKARAQKPERWSTGFPLWNPACLYFPFQSKPEYFFL